MRILCVALTVLAASAVACSGADTAAPGDAAERFHAAIAAHQEEAACGMLARKTADKLPDPGQTCADALRDARLGPGGKVTAVSIWGDEAQVRLAGDTLFLHHFTDGWRIKAAGCRPVHDLPYDCEVED